jgi:hypothetical protein
MLRLYLENYRQRLRTDIVGFHSKALMTNLRKGRRPQQRLNSDLCLSTGERCSHTKMSPNSESSVVVVSSPDIKLVRIREWTRFPSISQSRVASRQIRCTGLSYHKNSSTAEPIRDGLSRSRTIWSGFCSNASIPLPIRSVVVSCPATIKKCARSDQFFFS